MNQAIFLSYASQDTDAARRICDALRAAGLEVWFDQSELRGGDAWDGSIRKQIKECALFVPMISASTNARSEGYFRLEWKLAVDRSHLMADDQPFFLPVILDDSAEPTARVPDKFRERQWTRLNEAAAIADFATRVSKLIAGSGSQGKKAMEGSPVLVSAVQTVSTTKDVTPSIAVLAFANRSASADDEYFSDGLADELLNVLARIKGLRVAARTSAFSFKGKQATVAEIGRALNVATVLEGSVRKSGNRVRISVQLVKVEDGFQLWGETYDRTMDDIFAVQDDIAQAVVEGLRERILGSFAVRGTPAGIEQELAAAVLGRSDNSEAFSLYLKSRFLLERFTGPDLLQGIAFLEKAVALDPEFALAYAALGQIHIKAAAYGEEPLMEGVSRAREAVREALALQPQLVEAHLALGGIQFFHDWDWPAAETSLSRALVLAPGNAEALREFGMLMYILGRIEPALDHCRRAIALDPMNASGHGYLGLFLEAAGEPVAAEAAIREALEISPQGMAFRYWLVLILVSQGMHEKAVVEASADSSPWARPAGLAYAYRAWGRREESEAPLRELAEKFADVAQIQLAMAYAASGETELAFSWLERAYAQRDAGMPLIKSWPHFHALPQDPRWHTLLKKMRLAD